MSESDIEEDEDSDKTLEGIGSQLSIFERQFRKQLQNLNTKIESYHFSIQKEGEGITVDFALRTTIRMKQKDVEE